MKVRSEKIRIGRKLKKNFYNRLFYKIIFYLYI